MPRATLESTEKVWDFLEQGEREAIRLNYLWGGAASAKSWTVALYLISLALTRNVGIMCLRKTRPAVRTSCLRLIEKLLIATEQPFRLNKTTFEIVIEATGARIMFDGVDDVRKKKSIEGINYLWLEEATEFAHHDFLQMNLRARAHNPYGINRVFVTFNPENEVENAWLKDLVDHANTTEGSQSIHLTYEDNPYLSDEEIKQIEALIDADAEYDKIYRQGLWATPSNIIYSGWKIVNDLPDEYEDRIWGLDFGFALPSALVEIRFCGKKVYEREHLYEPELTSTEIVERLLAIVPMDDYIICDSARPEIIHDLCRAGLNAIPCIKGPDSVVHGIATVRRYDCHITADSANLITEKAGYKWKTDKQGNVRDDPVKFQDHLMDAERYAITWLKGISPPGVEFAQDDENESPIEEPTMDDIMDDRLWN